MTNSSKDGQSSSITQSLSALRLLIGRHYQSGRLGTYSIRIVINLAKLLGYLQKVIASIAISAFGVTIAFVKLEPETSNAKPKLSV